jgi:hypothetical protein
MQQGNNRRSAMRKLKKEKIKITVLEPGTATVRIIRRVNNGVVCDVKILQSKWVERCVEMVHDDSIEISVSYDRINANCDSEAMACVAAAQAWYKKYAPRYHINKDEFVTNGVIRLSTKSKSGNVCCVFFTPLHVFHDNIDSLYIIQYLVTDGYISMPERRLAAVSQIHYSNTTISRCTSTVWCYYRNDIEREETIRYGTRRYMDHQSVSRKPIYSKGSTLSHNAIVSGLIESCLKRNILRYSDVPSETIAYFSRINKYAAAILVVLLDKQDKEV